MGRGRRQGRGLPEASESENLETDSTRPAPPEGGAANLKASPLPPAPLLTAAGRIASWLVLQYSEVFILFLPNSSYELCAGSLDSGCYFPGHFFK